ncbi:hypothetical protein GGR50DRAFT_540351 [Xylaria sp. CBS 124048]|nr:hypothetical protein GGR50DRAFT_540351 [Xylaria sp. CBS 124048]
MKEFYMDDYMDDIVSSNLLLNPGLPGSPTSTVDSLPREPMALPANAANNAVRRYIPKRPHRKTRTGCKQCKKRRVKCDEARPVCDACARRKEPCVYPHSEPVSSMEMTLPESGTGLALRSSERSGKGAEGAAFVGKTPVVTEPLFLPGQADVIDTKMLWFYTSHAFQSFSINAGRSPAIDYALRVKVLEYAFQSPFLMEAVKALSALHLLTLHQPVPSRKITAYLAGAFQGYRDAIHTANPNDHAALLACSLFVIAISSHNFRDPGEGHRLFIIEWLAIWRGIGVVINLISSQSVRESGLSSVFCRPPLDMDKASPYIPNNLLFMVASIKEDDPDYKYQADYYDFLKCLGSLYRELIEYGFGPILDLRIITFFTFYPRALLPLARHHSPRVLVVIAYWLCFVKLLSHSAWWMTGITPQAEQIFNELGPEWDQLLRVPRMVMQTEGMLAIASLIIHNRNWTSGELEFYNSRRHDNPSMEKDLEFVASDRNELDAAINYLQFEEIGALVELRRVCDQDTAESDLLARPVTPCYLLPGSLL